MNINLNEQGGAAPNTKIWGECQPKYKEKIRALVVQANALDTKLVRIVHAQSIVKDSKTYVLKFLCGCMIRHRDLLWGMLHSFCYNKSGLDGFIYLKHNFEYIAVIAKVEREIKEVMTEGDWENIATNHLYNIKSIIKYCKDAGRDEEVKQFEELGKQESIIKYINKMPDIFLQQYAIINALSHPNYYTILGEEFPFINGEPVEYLIDQSCYLQELLEQSVDAIIGKMNLPQE